MTTERNTQVAQPLPADYAGDAYRACLAGHADAREQMSAACQIALLQGINGEMLTVLLKLRKGDLHQRVRPLYDEVQRVIAKATGAKQ